MSTTDFCGQYRRRVNEKPPLAGVGSQLGILAESGESRCMYMSIEPSGFFNRGGSLNEPRQYLLIGLAANRIFSLYIESDQKPFTGGMPSLSKWITYLLVLENLVPSLLVTAEA